MFFGHIMCKPDLCSLHMNLNLQVPHDDDGAAIPVPDGAVEAGLRGSQGEKFFKEQVARAIDLDHEERSSEEDFMMSMPEGVSPVSGSSDEEPNWPKCYDFSVNMKFNSLLQDYIVDGTHSPDENAHGTATLTLCTDGKKLTSTAMVMEMGVTSTLIASHLHKCPYPDRKVGIGCGNGPPVINFCGKNGDGMINEPGMYPEECMPYNKLKGMSVNKNMTGVMSDGVDMSIEKLVNDIGENPDHYYMNFHLDQSWLYWNAYGDGSPVGMCRGPLSLYLS